MGANDAGSMMNGREDSRGTHPISDNYLVVSEHVFAMCSGSKVLLQIIHFSW
jgi:hypothetical protein